MIVENRTRTIEKAHEIKKKLLHLIEKEIKRYNCDDDPAEHIYLIVHTLSNFLSTMLVIVEGYGKTYAIPSLTVDKLTEWMSQLSKEYIGFYREIK